jgi:hypothetical protein
MPPDPPRDCVLTHTDKWPCPPLFSHLLVLPPPLGNFLNEGLEGYIYHEEEGQHHHSECTYLSGNLF